VSLPPAQRGPEQLRIRRLSSSDLSAVTRIDAATATAQAGFSAVAGA
jgi:hypothetical protein